jgi:hypothetical protein
MSNIIFYSLFLIQLLSHTLSLSLSPSLSLSLSLSLIHGCEKETKCERANVIVYVCVCVCLCVCACVCAIKRSYGTIWYACMCVRGRQPLRGRTSTTFHHHQKQQQQQEKSVTPYRLFNWTHSLTSLRIFQITHVHITYLSLVIRNCKEKPVKT